MSAKWLELLKQIAPNVTRVAVMGGNFAGFDGASQLKAIQDVAPSFGVEASPIEVGDAGQIERGISAFAQGANDGLIVTENVATFYYHRLIVTLAARLKMTLHVSPLAAVEAPARTKA